MFNLLAALLSVLSTLALSPACSPGRAATASPWSVRVKTSGGFTGRGVGKVLIVSTGRVRYERPETPDRRSRGCEGRLTEEELRRLNKLIGESNPGGWEVSGPNAAAADAISYELELKAGGRTHQITWYDNTRAGLPEDLLRLHEEVSRVMTEQARKCAA